ENGGKGCGAQAIADALDPIAVAAQLLYIRQNGNPLGSKDAMLDGGDGSAYSAEHARHHAGMRSLQQQFGYYDVFLIDGDGRIVYSVFKELDFATSLADGPWAGSNLGTLYRELQDQPAGATAFADFATYRPSYDGPAAFLGTTLEDGDERVGYLVVQLPIDRTNQVVAATAGLGRTGEIVLVGPDHLMRSDSRHHPATHSVASSFRNPGEGQWPSAHVDEALAGESGNGADTDRSGNAVLAAWEPLDIFGHQWAMLASFHESELLAGKERMTSTLAESLGSMLQRVLLLAVVAAIAVAILSWLSARRIVTPINRTVAALHDIAEGDGDLTARLDDSGRDELGQLAAKFNLFLGQLRDTVRTIAEHSDGVSGAAVELTQTADGMTSSATRTKHQSSQVAAAAEQLTANMSSLSQSSEHMAGTLRTVAAAVEQMTASISEVAKSADNAAGIAGTAAQLTQSSNVKIKELGEAASQIGRVVEAIQDIAEQTNLLALNATIEAARAGEA
ncbi:MAG: methyl-accepting chemotaxis protein, partial [Planctomycetes bacterium]|nr:methyl-accepting chemotaxis protein [Planctomycetota bacterium]